MPNPPSESVSVLENGEVGNGGVDQRLLQFIFSVGLQHATRETSVELTAAATPAIPPPLYDLLTDYECNSISRRQKLTE